MINLCNADSGFGLVLARTFNRPDAEEFLREMPLRTYLMWREFFSRSPWAELANTPQRDQATLCKAIHDLDFVFNGKKAE